MKRTLSLILVLVLALGLLAGCSGGNETTGGGSSGSSSGTTSGNTGATSGSSYTYVPYTLDDVDPALLEADDSGNYTWTPIDISATQGNTVPLPLADELSEFSAWISFQSNYFTDLNDVPNIIELERRTNVHVKWDAVSSANAGEAFSMLMVSNDFPDMIFDAERYVGGGDVAIRDEVYLALNDLVDQYCPNFKAAMNISDDHRRAVLTNEGNIWAFIRLERDPEPGWYGTNIRKDFLDSVGMEKPHTLDEYEKLFDVAMQNGFEYGVGIQPTSITANNSFDFMSAYDVNPSFYHIGDKVYFGPAQPAYKDYLARMNEWYTKGYIAKEFYTPADYGAYVDEVLFGDLANNGCVVAQGFSAMFLDNAVKFGKTENPNVWIEATKAAVLNAGDETHFSQYVLPKSSQAAAISTQAKDPALCARWMDYFFTTEGMILNHYGVEGISYIDNGDGSITMTKLVSQDEEGTSNARGKYAYTIMPTMYDYTIGYVGTDWQETVANCRIWDSDGTDYVLPDFDFLNSEDAAKFSSTYSDIETYVNEMTIKFIIGTESLDNFDSFVAKINQMGLDTCLQLKQAAFSAYYAR